MSVYPLTNDKIYDRTTGRSGRGDASVSRVVWAIIYFWKKQKINTKDVLFDYNANRHAPSEVLFRRKLFFYQLNNHYFTLKNRIKLFKALLVYFFKRDQKQFSISYAELLAFDIGENLSQDINIYFFNPYTIRQYLLLKTLSNKSHAYIHTPYYLVFQADNIWTTKFIAKLYNWYGNVKNINPTHKKLEERCKNIRIYFSQLSSNTDNEKRLRQFVYFLSNKGIKVEIFLHYLDRSSQIKESNSKSLIFYNTNKSMDCICDKQLSFSGSSSIGYELLSLDINHYIFTRDDKIFKEINKKYNNFNFFKNFKSLLSISFNSIKKYGFK